MRGERMYRYELHMHTQEGSACGHSSVHDMIKRYKELGFSGAVVTNHFFSGNTCVDRTLPWRDFVMEYSRAYFEGQKTAKELDFDLLFGVEEQYGGGKEFLVCGIEPEFLLERPGLHIEYEDFLKGKRADIALWSREVRAAGGFIAYAHPFRDRPYITDPDKMPDLSLVDGIEVYNYCNKPEENIKAAYMFASSGKAIIAGSDLHATDFDDAYGVWLPKRARTGKALSKALLNKNFTVAVPEVEQ